MWVLRSVWKRKPCLLRAYGCLFKLAQNLQVTYDTRLTDPNHVRADKSEQRGHPNTLMTAGR